MTAVIKELFNQSNIDFQNKTTVAQLETQKAVQDIESVQIFYGKRTCCGGSRSC